MESYMIEQLREEIGGEEVRRLISQGCLLVTQDWNVVQHPECDHNLF